MPQPAEMSSTFVLPPQPAFDFNARMKVQSFKGDGDLLLDKLIAASQRKEAPMESLKERTLVPFFDSSEASAATFQSLQPGRHPAASRPVAVPASPAGSPHGLKRHAHERSSAHLAGSPPKKESEVVKAKHQRRGGKQAASATGTSPASSGGKPSGGSHSDSETTSARKPRGGAVATKPAPTASPAVLLALGKKHQRAATGSGPQAQRQSPPSKRAEPMMDMAQLAAASAAAGAMLRTPGNKGAKPVAAAPATTKFAGPAFTISPTPDCLPLPTSLLMMGEAADGLAARLTL